MRVVLPTSQLFAYHKTCAVETKMSDPPTGLFTAQGRQPPFLHCAESTPRGQSPPLAAPFDPGGYFFVKKPGPPPNPFSLDLPCLVRVTPCARETTLAESSLDPWPVPFSSGFSLGDLPTCIFFVAQKLCQHFLATSLFSPCPLFTPLRFLQRGGGSPLLTVVPKRRSKLSLTATKKSFCSGLVWESFTKPPVP